MDQATIPMWQKHPEFAAAQGKVNELRAMLGDAQKDQREAEAGLSGKPTSAIDIQALRLLGSKSADKCSADVAKLEEIRQRVAVLTRAVELAEAAAAEVKGRVIPLLTRDTFEAAYRPLARKAALAYVAFTRAVVEAQAFLANMHGLGLEVNPLHSGIPLGGFVPGGVSPSATDRVNSLIAGGWITSEEVDAVNPSVRQDFPEYLGHDRNDQ